MSDRVKPEERSIASDLARERGSDVPLEDLTGWEAFKRGTATTFKEAFDFKAMAQTPYGVAPVLMFILLATVGPFSGVFGLAAPEIIRDLDLNLIPLLNVLGIVQFFGIFLALWLGFVADRRRRTWIVGGGTIVGGVSAIMTGRVSNLWGLGTAQTVGAVGNIGAATPTLSLLSDWYPANTWARWISMVRGFQAFAGAAAPITILWLIKSTTTDPAHPNWRLPYLVVGPVVMIVGILIFRLKEPTRGYTERVDLGVPEELARIPEEPPSFGESWRAIWAIRTIRRLFLASIFQTAGANAVAVLVTLFLFEHYHLAIEDRARFGLLTALPVIPVAFLAGGVGDVLIRRRPHRVLIYTGSIEVIGSLFLFWFAFGPPIWIVYAQTMIFVSAIALFAPLQGALLLHILPPHIRTMGTAVQLLAAVPGTIIYFLVVNNLVSTVGIRGGILASVPLFLIGAFVQMSAAGFFEGDDRARRAGFYANEEWRLAKERGTSKLLVCRNLDVGYEGVQVLFDVDFDVEEGQTLALLGTNGAGKSTLLKAIAGAQEASGGAIVFDGRDITHMPPHETAGRGIVLMPGGRGIFPGLTVRENLLLGSWMTEEQEAKSRLDEVFTIFPLLKDRADEKSGMLSGGEQQMLSLAQAFLGKPRLLLIDELSLGLSPVVVQELIEIVKRINEQGTAIVLVEQSVNIALTVADRAIFMEKGEVKFFGLTKDLLRRPDILRAVYVRGTGALSEGAPASAFRSERQRRQMALERAHPVLDVQGLSKRFGGVVALDEVSFALREGEVLGLIGPNGAGKTTVFDIVSGHLPADSGRVIFDQVDVTGLGPDERARRRLVRRFQDARLAPSLTVYENLLLALDRKLEVKSMVFTALQLPQVRQAERRLRRRADRLIELLDISGLADKFVRELSTGLRRITDLACVLATEPRLLLLDEPSTGIAQAEAESLAPLLRNVRFETGCSMLIIEHDMSLISSISDELLAMDQGRVVLRGTPDEVLNDSRVIEAYLGTSEESIRRSGVIA